MRVIPVIAIFLCGSIAHVIAQARAQFEVAAIKPSPGPQRGCRGGPGTADPGRMSCLVTLANLVMKAYQLKSHQFTPPDWMQDGRFEIDVKIPAEAT